MAKKKLRYNAFSICKNMKKKYNWSKKKTEKCIKKVKKKLV